jgi:uncharacterized membrane protein YeaQ/YmgE (transglycosylase-associated protein family)
MNSLLGATMWVAIGWFVAWIETKVLRDRRPASGVANVGVGVLGGLVGGFAVRAAVGARTSDYHAFILCGLGAAIVSATLIWLTPPRTMQARGRDTP